MFAKPASRIIAMTAHALTAPRGFFLAVSLSLLNSERSGTVSKSISETARSVGDAIT